jgi:hypothetical protein
MTTTKLATATARKKRRDDQALLNRASRSLNVGRWRDVDKGGVAIN